MRREYEYINDNIWLEATHQKDYYKGKIEGCLAINQLLDECKDKDTLKAKILEEKKAAEASRDAEEKYYWYDGEVAAYREMLEEMEVNNENIL